MKISLASIFHLFLICFTPLVCVAQERIFYSSFSPQDWDVYLSADGGKTYAKFTDHPSLDYDAVISPDGKWVVFTSERSGMAKLYARPVDGSREPSALLESDSFQDQAAFSPDGSTIAFVSAHEGNAEVYSMPFVPDSTQGITDVRNLSNDAGGDFRPAFSPDGSYVAFCSDRGHEVTPHPQFPFARQRIGDIYSVAIASGQVKRLTDSDGWDGSPVWTADGTGIIFYSTRSGMSTLFEMKADGSDQRPLLELDIPAVSPRVMSDGAIVFTTWSGESDFQIMRSNPGTGVYEPMVLNGPDLMFHADVHPSGMLVFHGGNALSEPGPFGSVGFGGKALAILPDTMVLSGENMIIHGVRRAFVAPPHPENTLLFYTTSDEMGMLDTMRPMGYVIFLLPLAVILLFLTGITAGIMNRKIISFWKYLLFCLVAIVSGIVVGIVFFYVDAIDPMPVKVIRGVMGVLSIVLIALSWWYFRIRKRRIASQSASFRLFTLYGILYFSLGIFSLVCALFINSFVHTSIQFNQLDYITGDVESVLRFEKEPDINPANFRVLDSKVTHDGKSLVFTTGSFRGHPHTQGDMWKYDFESQQVTKLSDSPANDGFADMSSNGTMVFRSGRSGFFDIYVESGGEVVNLTQDTHRDNFPAISPAGDRVVFASDRLRGEHDYKTMDIFIMSRREDNTWSEPEKISSGRGQNAHPHFSPDGEWIIYTTEGFGINDEQTLIQPILFSPQMYGEIVAYHIASAEHFRITHNKWEDGTPLWVK